MKTRIITALIIIGVLLPVFYFDTNVFKISVAILIMVSTHEILRLRENKGYLMYSKCFIYLLNTLPLFLISSIKDFNIVYIIIIMLGYYKLMLVDKKIDYKEISYLYTSGMLLIVASLSAIYLRMLDDGFYILIYVIFVTIISDTAAYFVGINFGKHKLIERISPNKTVEGLIGSMLFAVIAGVGYSLVFSTGVDNIYLIALISFILSISGAMGDLFFSSIKRTYGTKDFSNVLPGHGGVLDRIDSHLLNIIVYALFLLIMKGIV